MASSRKVANVGELSVMVPGKQAFQAGAGQLTVGATWTVAGQGTEPRSRAPAPLWLALAPRGRAVAPSSIVPATTGADQVAATARHNRPEPSCATPGDLSE